MGALASARDPRARTAVAALALAAAGFGGYLLVIQLAVIDAVCDWCLASDAISSLIAAVALARLLQRDQSARGRYDTKLGTAES